LRKETAPRCGKLSRQLIKRWAYFGTKNRQMARIWLRFFDH
jgi:hypothetical protein